MSIVPAIAVTNESTAVPDAEVEGAVRALQHQVTYDFRPFWNAAGRLVWFPRGSTPPPSMWRLSVLDDSDQAGALGYHDVTDGNQPLMKVFAGTDRQYGLSWTVTASHEILEALADPWVSACWQTSNTELYALEVGDPVEADELAYKGVDGSTLLSDFVLPAWFVPGLKAARYSFRGHAEAPLALAPGGYASVFVSGRGWTQLEAGADGAPRETELEPGNPRFRDRSRGNPLVAG